MFIGHGLRYLMQVSRESAKFLQSGESAKWHEKAKMFPA